MFCCGFENPELTMNTSNGAKEKNREKERDMTELMFISLEQGLSVTCTSYTIAHTYYTLVLRREQEDTFWLRQ